jgi:hypothetical protein
MERKSHFVEMCQRLLDNHGSPATPRRSENRLLEENQQRHSRLEIC